MSEKISPDTSAPAPPAGPKKLTVVIFTAGLTALFALNCWKRDFGDPDEALFAHISRGMESGSWLVPSFEGPFLELPPLGYWLPAALHRLTGLDPRLAYRLAVVAAAGLSLALTYVLGKRLFDGRIGFLGMLVQGSTAFFYWRASWLDDDLLFAVWVQLALTAFVLATRAGAGPGWAWLGWIGLALAALTKSGVLALVLTFSTLLLFLFFAGGFGAVRAGCARLRPLPGVVLFLALSLPWFVAVALRAGSSLYADHIAAAHSTRLFDAGADARPPYYYPVALLLGFLPWTLFLPLGLLHGKDRLRRDGERLAFLWAMVPLVLLTLASAKKPGYALVVWPPLSLLIAAGLFETRDWFTVWEDFLREGVFGVVPLVLKLPAALALVAAGAYFGGYLAEAGDERVRALLAARESTGWALALAAGVAAVLFVVSGRVRRMVQKKDVTRAAFELACAALLLYATATCFYPAANPFISSRSAVEKLARAIPAEASVAVYGRKRAAVFYYLETARNPKHLAYPDVLVPDHPTYLAVAAHLRQAGPACLITSAGELESLRSQFASLVPYLTNVVATARAGLKEELVAVMNR